MNKTFFATLLLLVFSCSPDEETQAPTNNVQYTLSITAGEGGSVTDGGTFDDGTEVTITATPDEGYEFVGWEGIDSTSESLTVTLNSNQTYQALFELIIQYQYNEIIPLGGNAYNTSGVENLIIDSNGIQAWINTEIEFTVYVYSSKELDCNLTFPIKTSQNSIIYSVLLNEDFFEVEVLPNKSEIDLGTHTLKKGYNAITLKGLSTADVFPKLTDLNIYSNELLNLNYVKENSYSRFYWGKRGPYLVLWHRFPQNTNIKWMYSEVEIPEGYDQKGLYAVANGSSEGYFGMQVNSTEERRILFSIWSPYITDDPNDIPQDQRIQLIKSGEEVYIGEFGDEGSGGQSYLIYPWKAGVNYSFLKSVEPDGNGNTIYTAYFKDPEEGEWKLIASFLRPQTNTWYKGAYSFLENFLPKEGFKTRKAYYSNLWAINSNGDWYRINNTRFSSTVGFRENGIGDLDYRLDFQGGVELNKFYLIHCGFFDPQTEDTGSFINKKFDLFKSDQRDHPLIDFDLLP